MKHSALRRFLCVAVLLGFAAAAIPGCSSKKVEGKYVGGNGMLTIEFKGGKATIGEAMGSHSETADYTVEGDKITVKAKDGTVVFTLLEDGSLSGPPPLGILKRAAS